MGMAWMPLLVVNMIPFVHHLTVCVALGAGAGELYPLQLGGQMDDVWMNGERSQEHLCLGQDRLQTCRASASSSVPASTGSL